jgi:hypothetical protein
VIAFLAIMWQCEEAMDDVFAKTNKNIFGDTFLGKVSKKDAAATWIKRGTKKSFGARCVFLHG